MVVECLQAYRLQAESQDRVTISADDVSAVRRLARAMNVQTHAHLAQTTGSFDV
jgi:hypothetical protein